MYFVYMYNVFSSYKLSYIVIVFRNFAESILLRNIRSHELVSRNFAVQELNFMTFNFFYMKYFLNVNSDLQSFFSWNNFYEQNIFSYIDISEWWN